MPVRLREETAVKEVTAAQSAASLAFAREQLLRDGVAVVVREHVHGPDLVLGEQRLAEVGLLLDGVLGIARLLGETETEHVERVSE